LVYKKPFPYWHLHQIWKTLSDMEDAGVKQHILDEVHPPFLLFWNTNRCVDLKGEPIVLNRFNKSNERQYPIMRLKKDEDFKRPREFYVAAKSNDKVQRLLYENYRCVKKKLSDAKATQKRAERLSLFGCDLKSYNRRISEGALLEVVKDCTTCNETGAPVFVQCSGCGDLRHLNCIDLPQPFVVQEVVGFKCGTCATTGDDDFISCLTEDTASKMKSSELATSIEKHLIDHDDAPPPPAQGAPKPTLLKYVVDNVVGANSPGKRGLVKGRKAAAAAEALQPAAPTSNKRQKSRSTYGTGDR